MCKFLICKRSGLLTCQQYETTVNFKKCNITHIIIELRKNFCKNVIFCYNMLWTLKAYNDQILYF